MSILSYVVPVCLILVSRNFQLAACLLSSFTSRPAVWNERSISLSSKIRLMRSLATSIVLYACESSILTAELQRRIRVKEMGVLPQDTTNLIHRQCYRRGSLCQNHRKETRIEVAWTCLPFIRSGQNHLARHSERGRTQSRPEKEAGRQHRAMDRPGSNQVPEGSGEQRKMDETGCEVICGALATPAIKG